MAAIDPSRVVADLRELKGLTGDDDGAQRVAWTETWTKANDWSRDQLPASDGVSVEADAAGNLWATAPGDSERFVIIGGHLDSVPNGGGLDLTANLLPCPPLLGALAGPGVPSAPPAESIRLTGRLVGGAVEAGGLIGRSLMVWSAAAGTLEPDS